MAFVVALTARVAAFGENATITLPNGRNVTIAVPEGMEFQVRERDSGPTVVVLDASKSVSLQLSFLPASSARFETADQQKALLAEMSHDDVEQSVEQQLAFKELKPSSGGGLYLVLTDGNLLERVPPPGQYLKLTRGIRVSSDLVMVFTLFSQSETAEAYRAAMAVVRNGVSAK